MLVMFACTLDSLAGNGSAIRLGSIALVGRLVADEEGWFPGGGEDKSLCQPVMNHRNDVAIPFSWTYRKLEVGADATDASAANPGSEVLTETKPEKVSS